MCTVLLPTAVSPISINIYIYIYIYTHTYYYYYYSDRNMAMGLTKPLTENSTRNIFWGKGGRYVGLTKLLPSCADCLEIWEPQPPGKLRVFTGL